MLAAASNISTFAMQASSYLIESNQKMPTNLHYFAANQRESMSVLISTSLETHIPRP